MPSAKVADSQLCRIVQEVNCEKNEEEKKRDLELFKKLDVRRQNLEDKLFKKLEELKAACVQEGELTGNLPKEIYKTLMPGETEPKIKRRVGTTFKYSQQVLQCTTNDQTGQLEADVELHRKIVAAAERLAKDKNTNKSVRKKRRKDWQAATQKLKSLEKRLYKFHVSYSKPDVSAVFDSLLMSNCSNNGSGFSLNNLKGWPNLSHYSFRGLTKSCPTTPQGSVPDLSVIGGNNVKLNNGRQLNMSMNSKKSFESQQQRNELIKFPSSKSLPNNNTQLNELEATATKFLPSAQLPPTIPHRRLLLSALSVSSVLNNAQQSSQKNFAESPLYANIGYTSSIPYKSAYRQSNFQTIQDSKQTNLSNNCLKKTASTISTSTCFSVEKSFDKNCVIEYPSNHYQRNKMLHHENESFTSTGSHDLSNIHRQFQQQRCSSSSQSSAGSISIGSIASTASSSGYHSSNLQVYPLIGRKGISALDESFSDFKKPLSSGTGGYSTTSLDRRIIKESSTSSLLTNDDNSYLKFLYNKRSRLGPNAMITTFPVNDYCRPLELSDFNKYRSNSAVRVVDPNWPLPSTSLTLKKTSMSASRLPSFSSATLSRYPNNYQYNFPVFQTDSQIEAFLASICSRSSCVYNSNQKTIAPKSSIENTMVVVAMKKTSLSNDKNATMV